MQANWSLILNVLLLIGVVVAIGRLMKARRQNLNNIAYQPSLGKVENKSFDEVIAVRKVNPDFVELSTKEEMTPSINLHSLGETEQITETDNNLNPSKSIMMFLQAKENRQLAGYELLQTILSVGLRFGEGHLFHRHQHPNGQGPVLCSLAAATSTGVFDLQNIGAFSVRGLCLFMQSSGNRTIDAERFSIMLETAKQLSDDLDTYLLDDKQQPLTQEKLNNYYRILNINEDELTNAMA